MASTLRALCVRNLAANTYPSLHRFLDLDRLSLTSSSSFFFFFEKESKQTTHTENENKGIISHNLPLTKAGNSSSSNMVRLVLNFTKKKKKRLCWARVDVGWVIRVRCGLIQIDMDLKIINL